MGVCIRVRVGLGLGLPKVKTKANVNTKTKRKAKKGKIIQDKTRQGSGKARQDNIIWQRTHSEANNKQWIGPVPIFMVWTIL